MKLSKNLFAVILFAASFFGVKAQAVNSSYVTEFGEKALQFSIIVPGERAEVWKLFTTDQGLKKWISPVVKQI